MFVLLIVFDNFPTAFMIVLDCKDRLGFVKQHKCYFVTFDDDDDEKKDIAEGEGKGCKTPAVHRLDGHLVPLRGLSARSTAL